MTEIEKAHKGESVNLNKLAKELEKEFDELNGMMTDIARRKLAEEKVSRENAVENAVENDVENAAADVMLAVNAMINKVNADERLFPEMLNKINADERLLPVVISGLDACSDLIKGTFDDGERKLMEVLSE